ncbi:hypothetical protein THAOC_31245 [Thalassiosira oceanica]|uniref:Uncharacterized protein n=1 Tax=Thalassiosira oceanica TaxID=159749 RepID=K0R8J8_THAOC|nr:hypothetical protein THAOC_31245 [Thalassiosira oceanica]|eukprot:EJK49838.1 hypothetical protein THAOC_31245 [Thalassiosira oceanica]
MPPASEQVGQSLSTSLEVQQQQQQQATPPHQESAPPVQNDSAQPAMTALPAIMGGPEVNVEPAESKLPLRLSSLGPLPGAAAATTFGDCAGRIKTSNRPKQTPLRIQRSPKIHLSSKPLGPPL